MRRKNLATLAACALGSGVIISFCLAQKFHPSRPGNVTSISQPYDATRQAHTQKYESLVAQGDKLRAANPAAAVALYRQAVSVNPQPTDAWMGLARAFDAQGKQAQAFSAYGRVFGSSGSGVYSTFPSDVETLARYGDLCEGAGQHDAAIKACNQAVERLNPRPKVELGVVLDHPVASSELRAMLGVVRGIALDQQGKRGEALTAFSQAARFQPNDARVQFYRGYALRKAGQFAEAQAVLERAAALDTEGTVKAAAEENLRAVQAHRR